MSSLHHATESVHFGREAAYLAADDFGPDFEPSPEDMASLYSDRLDMEAGEGMPLATFLDGQADRLQGLGSASASWLAAELAELAGMARALEAATAEEFRTFRARAAWEASREDSNRAFSEGFDAGRFAGQGLASHHLG